MNVKVADNAGECQISVLAQGIKWAVDNGAKVINASLGAESLSDLQQSDLQEAVDYAWNKGAIVVAAAGNENTSTPSYPACCANCIAVAATDDTDSLASFSNHGDWVDVAAPGEHIYSTWLHNQHEVQDGTSSAAALVSGVVALVFGVIIDSNADGLVNDKVRWVIENSCSPITSIGSGKGRIDAFAAVRAAKQSIQTTTYALPSTESSTIH